MTRYGYFFILVLLGLAYTKTKQEKDQEFFANERKEDMTDEMHKGGRQDDSIWYTNGISSVTMKPYEPGLFEDVEMGRKYNEGRNA